LPSKVTISRFARESSRYVQRQLASRAGGRSPSMSSAGVQRPSQNITAPARSLTAQPLPTSMEAICTGLAHRRMIKSGHSINLGRTFRRRSQTGASCDLPLSARRIAGGQGGGAEYRLRDAGGSGKYSGLLRSPGWRSAPQLLLNRTSPRPLSMIAGGRRAPGDARGASERVGSRSWSVACCGRSAGDHSRVCFGSG
jgi:hypothetical protein